MYAFNIVGENTVLSTPLESDGAIFPTLKGAPQSMQKKYPLRNIGSFIQLIKRSMKNREVICVWLIPC